MPESRPAETAVPPEASDAPPARGPLLLHGTPVNPGLAMGPVHRKDHDLARVRVSRVPLDRVEHELNRFHQALSESKQQLEALKARLRGRVPEEHVRILDTHVAYLRDSVFLSDVENLILNEQTTLEGAIAKVIADFDRIFRLVQSDTLRERAVDLRDVGIRVLRNLERQREGTALAHPADHVLVARELSIVDMFNLDNDHVQGILTEEGSLAGHAAILARSMRIPTLTGIDDLLDQVAEGDFVILDATEGVVRVRPDELVRNQYRAARLSAELDAAGEGQPAWAVFPPRTADGEAVAVRAACGNLPEVERARQIGMQGVGLYRTELLYLLDRDQPSLDSLIAHYLSVVGQAGDEAVTFRLLDLDSSAEVPYLYAEREANPSLGRSGVRLLLAREAVLRRQLQAILRAARDARVRIAVPGVSDCGELRRVKEILFEERLALRKADIPFQEQPEVGVVVEAPVAALAARDLAREGDFLIVSLHSLQQHLLAADRDHPELAGLFERVHPFVLRVLRDLVRDCEAEGKPASFYGVTGEVPENLAMLLGIGARDFAIAPLHAQGFLTTLGGLDLSTARRYAERVAACATAAEARELQLAAGA